MKLVIMPTTELRAKMLERSLPLEVTNENLGFNNPHDLEYYGQKWANLWRKDIVMLVEEGA
jgi:hypothetical protein